MEVVNRVIANVDWITLVIFSSLLFVVIAKSLFYSRFLNFIILPFNNRYIFMYNKKDKLLNWFHIFFTLFQLLNFALFLFLSWKIFLPAASSPLLYLLILGVVLAFLALKVLLQLSNGFVFNNNKLISEFIFKKLSYLNYSSMLMFLANVILTYIFPGSKVVVIISIFLIVFINAIGWITIVKNHQKFITGHFFYFILYLCALEIAPLIIIANYLKD